MALGIFVLGRPGSGKSTAARYLSKLLDEAGYSVSHFGDFGILETMARYDTTRIRGVDAGGFDVLDAKLFEEALLGLERRMTTFLKDREARPKDAFIAEFARGEYFDALAALSKRFRRRMHILFLDADFEICTQRVRKRRASGGHGVSEFAMQRHYKVDNRTYMLEQAKSGSREIAIGYVENEGTFDGLRDAVKSFMERVIDCDVAQRSRSMPEERNFGLPKRIFVVGKPGSGKTSVCEYLHERISHSGIPAAVYGDYGILSYMANNDADRVRWNDSGGLHVIDMDVFDEALSWLAHDVVAARRTLSSRPIEVEIVRFARDDYVRALSGLGANFIKGAHVLYVDSPLEDCINNIRDRKSLSQRDQPAIPLEIMTEYYSKDRQDSAERLVRSVASRRLPLRSIRTLRNVSSHGVPKVELDDFLAHVLGRELPNSTAGTINLREHEMMQVTKQGLAVVEH